MCNLLGKGGSRGVWLSGSTVPVACPHRSPGGAVVVLASGGRVGHAVSGVVLRAASSLLIQLTQHFCELPQIVLLFLFTILLKHNMHTEKHTYLAAYQGCGLGRGPFPGTNNKEVHCLWII